MSQWKCSHWWPFPYLLLGVGHDLLLHSFRCRATSRVTPTPVMSSLICWCHVFLGRPRRLVPGIASSITLRVTLFSSLLWTCPNQRRRSLRITSSIGASCNMHQIPHFENICTNFTLLIIIAVFLSARAPPEKDVDSKFVFERTW